MPLVAPWLKMEKWNYIEYRGTCKIELKREMKLIKGVRGKGVIQIKNEVFEKIIN